MFLHDDNWASVDLRQIHRSLKKSRDYWSTEVISQPMSFNEYTTTFNDWLRGEYGIELIYENSIIQGISDFKVLDEQKFMLYMLRWA